MSSDASFADGNGRPLRLVAADPDDLRVLSSLLQDAVLASEDVTWKAREKRFAMLLNRFRWEDKTAQNNPERVRTMLVIEDVVGVRSQGFDPKMRDAVLSLLAVAWDSESDEVLLTFAGDGVIAVESDGLNVTLHDVTRPYAAPSGKRPEHPE